MKILLILFILTINCSSKPFINPCSHEYEEVVTTIIKKYDRNKILFKRKNKSAIYKYKIIPINTYPFFCGTVLEIPKKEIKYGCDYTIRSYSDGSTHVWIAVLHYIEWMKKVEPDRKFYVLHYLTQNDSLKWVEETDPKVIILRKTDRKKSYYGCP